MSRASPGRYVRVAVATGQIEADMMKSRLDAADILCVLSNSNILSYLQEPLPTDQIGVLVPRSMAADARAILGHSVERLGRKRRGFPGYREGKISFGVLVGLLMTLLLAFVIALLQILEYRNNAGFSVSECPPQYPTASATATPLPDEALTDAPPPATVACAR